MNMPRLSNLSQQLLPSVKDSKSKSLSEKYLAFVKELMLSKEKVLLQKTKSQGRHLISWAAEEDKSRESKDVQDLESGAVATELEFI